MGGMSAGSRFITARVASVPPVEAPRPMITRSRPGLFPSRGMAPAGVSARIPEGTPVGRTRAAAAITTFWARAARKVVSLVPWSSGLRTKSTAPTARASNTFRFREDTRITGMGWVGRYSLRKSMPLCPGISTSMVITSGLYWGILFLASRVLMA